MAQLVGYCLLLGGLFAGTAAGADQVETAGQVPLEVTALNPPANYEQTTDPQDRSQLTDGQLRSYPFWTRRESVGWVNRTPVEIAAAADLQPGGRYELLIRTAMQSSAGVYAPRRIEIYCQAKGSSRWQHAGSLDYARNAAHDSSVIELAVPFVACSGHTLNVVVHADGPFVMIDQVWLRSVTPGNPTSAAAGPTGIAASAVADPVADSRSRLESSLVAKERGRLRDAVQALGSGVSVAWVSAPWADLTVPKRGENIGILPLTAVADTDASYVVGIANADGKSHRYSLIVDPPALARTSAFAVIPVLAGDGKLVFDAIGTRRQFDFEAEANGLIYVFLTERGVSHAGVRHITVLDDMGRRQVLDVDIRVLDKISPGPADRPRVIVWTYTNDQPIWRRDNSSRIASELDAAGVNVFDIHPQHIPAPFHEAEWPTRVSALKADLALFRNRAMVLLLLDQETWQALVGMDDDAATRRRLSDWLGLITRVMSEDGFPDGTWALYPVDEPHGEDLDRLASVIRKLRELEPRLRFYANPTMGRGQQLATALGIRNLKGLVDYWQPRAGAAFEAVAAIVGNNGPAGLWVYENPKEPARSTSPGCYRDMGPTAFDAGARGFGFWSFSNTNGSSAWSDFDGQQPDWSVVYESESGVTSSRRWEAFKQGILDFEALSFCGRQSQGDTALQGQCAEFRKYAEATPDRGCTD